MLSARWDHNIRLKLLWKVIEILFIRRTSGTGQKTAPPWSNILGNLVNTPARGCKALRMWWGGGVIWFFIWRITITIQTELQQNHLDQNVKIFINMLELSSPVVWSLFNLKGHISHQGYKICYLFPPRAIINIYLKLRFSIVLISKLKR